MPALLDTMDGQSPVLQPMVAGSGFSVGQRAVDRKRFRHGRGAEKILLRGPAGRSAQVAYPIPAAPVIQELRLHAELACNRPGVQLAARVVLPRSKNLSTGRPFELLVRGGTISAGSGWEELKLVNLPQQLANHARVARAQHGGTLDERGAFVSQIVFLTPGGSGLTELIVDRIQVFGVISHKAQAISLNNTQPIKDLLQVPRTGSSASQSAGSQDQQPRIPRIIQWQGESFERLQKLGFSTIGLDRQPTREELQKADQLGLSLFCPPPQPEEISEQGISDALNVVLAWNLGDQLSAEDLNHIERWERQVARHDPRESRATVLAPQLHTLEASRVADVLLLGRAVVGTELTVRQHTTWLAHRQRLVRPGTPLWAQIESQPSEAQRMQMAALSSTQNTSQATTYSQLTALTSASLGIKPRGFYFQSHASLDAKDSATRRRALALELTNLRLQLVEPWLATRKELSSARSSQAELSALVLQAERSHLLVPVWWSQDLKTAVHPRKAGAVSFVVPGVAESSEAFLITLGGMQRVRHRRVTGGIRVSLEQLPADGLLMFSDDPQAISQVTRYLRRMAPRAARLRRELVNLRLQEFTTTYAQMQSPLTSDSRLTLLLDKARRELAACDGYVNSKNFEFAYHRADTVDLAVDQLLRELESELGVIKSPTSASNEFGSIALPDRLQLQRTLSRAPIGNNLLRGGGFESLPALLETGWRHKQLPLEGITTSVRLSPEAPHSGSYCLELEARALDEQTPTVVVPTSPVWITSAPLEARRGDLLEITGVVRLAAPLIGSVDGLQIIDSIGGTEMALRIREAPSWQPFRAIRAATTDSQVSVTVALSGLGKAQIDDLAVRKVRR